MLALGGIMALGLPAAPDVRALAPAGCPFSKSAKPGTACPVSGSRTPLAAIKALVALEEDEDCAAWCNLEESALPNTCTYNMCLGCNECDGVAKCATWCVGDPASVTLAKDEMIAPPTEYCTFGMCQGCSACITPPPAPLLSPPPRPDPPSAPEQDPVPSGYTDLGYGALAGGRGWGYCKDGWIKSYFWRPMSIEAPDTCAPSTRAHRYSAPACIRHARTSAAPALSVPRPCTATDIAHFPNRLNSVAPSSITLCAWLSCATVCNMEADCAYVVMRDVPHHKTWTSGRWCVLYKDVGCEKLPNKQ